MIKDSELVLAADGTLYHLHLGEDTLADDILLVGDPERVNMFKEIFEHVESEVQNRELHSLTGTFQGHRFTALSTGMGCDNIDIVLTELDACANMDLKKRIAKQQHRTLRMIRIGTCGSLHRDVPCGSLVASAYAIGLDGLIHYYRHDPQLMALEMQQQLAKHLQLPSEMATPYCVKGSNELLQRVARDMTKGITCTAPGFYGPQGRCVRIAPRVEDLNTKLASFHYDGLKVVNLEMETSGIYGLSRIMGHEALTVCLVIANRAEGTFLNEYHAQMKQTILQVIQSLL